MDLKKSLLVLFIIFTISFPFFFSPKKIEYKESNKTLPYIQVYNGKFKVYNKTLEKKGKFKKTDYFNQNNIITDNLNMFFYDKNASLISKKIIYKGKYYLTDITYITDKYKYLADNGIYDDFTKTFTGYKFKFFNSKIDGKGNKMIYKNDILTADNIKYTIKGLK